MHVALIPPKGLEAFALRSKFHLTLAIDDTMSNKQYTDIYKRAAKRGDYIIVDNGAAEGKLVSNDELLAAARVFDAHEVVLPDAMFDYKATVRYAAKFVKIFSSLQTSYKYMAVAQGKTLDSFYACVHELSDNADVRVIGIPRHMLETVGAKAARIDFANWIQSIYPDRFEIHLLGTNPVWLNEVSNAAKYASHIRSVDTALPFNYAIHGESLRTTLKNITRHENYFSIDWSKKVSSLNLDGNIRTLQAWAVTREDESIDAEACTSGM